jgi:4-aminobutyrate--pyruvate transaminase
MSKVFFTNSGSEANDTVMKLLWYRSNSIGEPKRKKFISRLRGYHGVTIGSASLTGLPYNHQSFDLPIEQVLHTSCPHYWRECQPGESEDAFSSRMAADLEALIEKEGPETIAAMFAEPVMGAGGVVVPPAGYWEKIQAVLKKHDILLVADEVICGFGRTGKLFGCQTFDIKPDVMVMSKQLTSTYFPMSAIMLNDKVFAPIRDESNRVGVLGHGFTGAGHPVGAAIANENLAIIEERKLVDNAASTGQYMQDQLRTLLDHPLVGEVRGVGMIAAVELVGNKETKEPAGELGRLGMLTSNALMKHGVISRPMKDAMAFCPPLIIGRDEVDLIISAMSQSLDEVQAQISSTVS